MNFFIYFLCMKYNFVNLALDLDFAFLLKLGLPERTQ